MRTITFDVDDEIEGHLLALAEGWEKDPAKLAQALFTEELLGQTSGSRGVPHSRRFWYRNADVYFTAEEREARERQSAAYWASPEGQDLQRQRMEDLELWQAKRQRKQAD